MQKSFLFIFFSIAYFSLLAQEAQTFSLKAFLPYWQGASITIIADGKKLQSGIIQNDIYSITGTIEKPKNAVLEIKKNNKTVFIPFILEPGTIRIRDKGNNLLEAFGTPENEAYLKSKNHIDSLTILTANFNNIKFFKRKIAAQLIRSNIQSTVSLQLLNDYFYLDNAIDDSTYFLLFDALDFNLKKTYLGKKIEDEANISRHTALGVLAPNLLLKDINNQPSSLYEKGNYTLIDFWASWCLPCKKELPAMIALHDKYKNKKFRMISFSLDSDETKLKEVVNNNKLSWTQLVDYKAWNSEAVKLYGIKTIPANFLLDENGVIIAKNLSPQAIDEKLAQLIQ